MVSSGTGQMPVKPSQGVLFLLQRNGLMAMNQSEILIIHTITKPNCGNVCLQGAIANHVFWISILVTHAPRPALGTVIAVSPNGRGACTVILSRAVSRRLIWGQTPGKANGSRRGAQLFVHVIDNGAWTSKALLLRFSDSEKLI